MSNRAVRAALVACIALAGCGEGVSDALTLEPSESSLVPQLVECPSSTSYSATGSILPLGGEVSMRGHSVALPLGAVALPVSIGIEEPSSRFMLIDLSANGQDHFQFLSPIQVTISYARCSRSNIERGPLSVWLVDPATGALLENMGGVDDKTNRRITFETDHFSGYAIAN
jgi:hypothetical protein